MLYLTEILKPPIFADDDKTRIARTLNTLLLITLMGSLLYLLFSLFSAASPYRWLLLIGGAVLNLSMLSALRRGHIKTVSIVLTFAIWTGLTLAALTIRDVQGAGFLRYSVAILVAGITFNWRVGLLLTAMSIVAALGIALYTALPLTIWASESVYLLAIALITRQVINELVQMKSALQKREREYRSLVENSTDFILRLDSQLRYRLVSSSLSQAMGITVADQVGKTNFEQRMPSNQAQVWDQTLLNTFKTGKPQTIELNYLIADDVRHFHARLTPEFATDGSVETVLGIIRDITDMKEAEKAMIEAERVRIEIEQNRELIELKERFLATASHDFRTPLTIIKANANMMEIYVDRLPLESRQAKLAEIQQQVDRMMELLNAVLTISKANAGRIEFLPNKVDLKAFCERIWEDMTQIDEQKHVCVHHYDAAAQPIMADENLLQYILVNLLSNAFKYTPAGREVQFDVRNSEQSVIFSVIDSGYGIPQSDLARLFEPFHRASNVKEIEGTGLGLAIVKKYAEVHGGTIDVASKEGAGTTFTVTIPLVLA